jgi:hypothetical protein
MKRRTFLAVLPAVALPAPEPKLPPATFNGIQFPPPMRIVRVATEPLEPGLLELLEKIMSNQGVVLLPAGASVEIIPPRLDGAT